MSVGDALIERARARKSARVVFPEGEDPRIQEAAERLVQLGVCEPILLREEEERAVPDRYVDLFLQGRSSSKPAAVARRLKNPMYFGAMMVRAGDADAVVAGCMLPTKKVLEAARLCIGLKAGVAIPSSCFIVEAPAWPVPLVFADCAVNVEPDSAGLAAIAIASADTARTLLRVEPRVAMLSFSTHGSASHESIDRVRKAVELVRGASPELAIDGELQADAALSRVVAAQKVTQASGVAGEANVLVFPNLESGNIGYKLVQQLGDAHVIGPLLQGFAAPVADLSRGAGVEEIVNTTVAALAIG